MLTSGVPSTIGIQAQPLFTLNLRGTVWASYRPVIMGILNVTPDSFSDGGNFTSLSAALHQIEKLIQEGADIIDIGGASSRPGADIVPVEEEWKRLEPAISHAIKEFPSIPISVDTWRAEVARRALDLGVHMINDISAGTLEPEIIFHIAKAKAPLIIMHMQGTPLTMQVKPEYGEVIVEIVEYLTQRINEVRKQGILDIIIDPGFGFGKTMEHTLSLIHNLKLICSLGVPVLTGFSRKSFLSKITGASALNTEPLHAILNYQALQAGVLFLRVHDVASAHQALAWYLKSNTK